LTAAARRPRPGAGGGPGFLYWGAQVPLIVHIGEQQVDLGHIEAWLTYATLVERREHEGRTYHTFTPQIEASATTAAQTSMQYDQLRSGSRASSARLACTAGGCALIEAGLLVEAVYVRILDTPEVSASDR
jgi:hypothetical protein